MQDGAGEHYGSEAIQDDDLLGDHNPEADEEFDVTNFEVYESGSDEDQFFAMTDEPSWPARHTISLKMKKVPQNRPVVPLADKECLVTYTTINGMKAWTLWDSGSTATGASPSFAQHSNMDVFPLANPHTLQLGTVGSRSMINFGSMAEISFPGANSGPSYIDVANFDRYDLIIGTPWMRQNKVILDFKTNQVIVNGIASSTTRIPNPDTDDHVCWH